MRWFCSWKCFQVTCGSAHALATADRICLDNGMASYFRFRRNNDHLRPIRSDSTVLFLWECLVSHVIPVALKHFVRWLLCLIQSGRKLGWEREVFWCWHRTCNVVRCSSDTCNRNRKRSNSQDERDVLWRHRSVTLDGFRIHNLIYWTLWYSAWLHFTNRCHTQTSVPSLLQCSLAVAW
jgi:hypothetical protein